MVSSKYFLLSIRYVVTRLYIHVDYYNNSDKETDLANLDNNFFIRYYIDISPDPTEPSTLIYIRRTKLTRAELKIQELGREYIEASGSE